MVHICHQVVFCCWPICHLNSFLHPSYTNAWPPTACSESPLACPCSVEGTSQSSPMEALHPSLPPEPRPTPDLPLISMFAKLLVLFFTVLLLTFTAAPLLGQTLATPARTNCLRKQEMLKRYLVLPESLKHSDRLWQHRVLQSSLGRLSSSTKY